MRTSISDLAKMKQAGQRIVMLTAYDYPSARLAEKAGVNVILVGDSVGQVVHGFETTLQVTVDDIIVHARAVGRGSQSALVVGDLPFLSYATAEDAIRSAGRMMREAGVQAVKLEGGVPMAPIVKRLVELGIPVMGHLGYTPQSTHQIGVKVQGKSADAARQILIDALALQEAGAFAIVLELVPQQLAGAISERLTIPTIGIGAGAGCDGQVQVWHDVLGLIEGKAPRHAKRFGEVGQAVEAALKAYVEAVQSRAFPTGAQSASMTPEALEEALRLEKP